VLAAERKEEILARLGRDGRVVVAELVAGLSVSEDTVRRDLQELAALGLLRRVHGGALASTPGSLSFEQRLEIDQETKARLAEAAVPLVESSRTLLLDGGTTALEVARRLPSSWDGVVVTNAPPVAAALAAHPNAEVLVVGGRLLKDEQVAVGPAAVDAFRAVRADACVLGVCAFDPAIGVTTANDAEAQVKRAMVASSTAVIALATRDKLHTSSPWVVAPLDEIDHLITNGDEDLTGAFAAAGLDVVTV
jgi:DeoR/GlpR family transcriptional regulator of sugar metabolism